MLLLLLACDGADPAPPSDACTLTEADGNAECPLDPCADQCTSVDEGLACCVAAHGFGEPGSAVTDSFYCTDGVAYDPGDFLSAEAAICAAQVQGLASSVGACGTTFGMCDGVGRWMVEAHDRESCGSSSGKVYSLDAVTGVVGSTATVFNDGVCDE